MVNATSHSGAGLTSLRLNTQYRTGEIDPVEHFYLPCLRCASRYDRAVGYFRSSIYILVGRSVLEFARRGGKIRLVCSPSLAQVDVQSIANGYEDRKKVDQSLLTEIEEMLRTRATTYPTRVLATLVALGALDIKIALRPLASGLYHEKIGLFEDDEGSIVSFLGSANETWSGWHEQGNHEALEVFCSWLTQVDQERVLRHQRYFYSLWNSRVTGLDVIDFPSVAKDRLLEASFDGFDEAIAEAPVGPNNDLVGRVPMPHQEVALTKWRAQGCRGVFAHATGSGKTFLALTAVKDHVKDGDPALIVVPSKLLLKQWAEEIQTEIPSATLLVCGGGNARWANGGKLKSMSAPGVDLGPRLLLSTMQTAATEKFRRLIVGGDHLMVVADEVHQVGSPFNSEMTSIDSGPRIGLSATPERYGDPVGTDKIFAYFGKVVPPKVTLADAIKAGRLVEYEYYPHTVHLSAEEAEEWREYTRRIGQEIAKGDDDSKLSERAKMLLIQRSRIAKKAACKISLVLQVLSAGFRPEHRWLIYCEDSDQLKQVLLALHENGMAATEYHSAMEGDPAATMEWFRSAGGILVSIKCLDEGVDIPAADHALILASSQNPRQFIQRRGRVLRRAPGKHLAVIHDAIVVPPSIESEPEQTSLARSELRRAIEFSRSAINRNAGGVLRRTMIDMGIDPDDPTGAGFEEDE